MVRERCQFSETESSFGATECWEDYALHGIKIDEEEYRKYHSVGRKIAKKLGQSPIAATTVASRLRMHAGDILYWIHVMQSDLWKDCDKYKKGKAFCIIR
jgi:hypothetical protein